MFKKIDYYKPMYKDVIGRFERLYKAVETGESGHFIYRAYLDGDAALYESIKPNRYDYINGLSCYADDLARETEHALNARKEASDDTLPFISPILGIGDYSAFLGGEIIFSESTSWSQPILKRLEDWRELAEPGTAPWYGRFMSLSRLLMERVRHTGIPYMRGFFSPLDLAHALRGSDLYTDFYDNANQVHELLQYCAAMTIRFAGGLKSLVYEELGDTEYGTWFFRDAVNMSEDIACMVSPALYREFGAPYTQQVVDFFGSGFLHCHSRALYMVEEICRLKNVKNVWIATDPNQPDPMDMLGELIQKANNVCLAVASKSFDDVRRSIDIAKDGNVDFCVPAESIEQANRQADYIRRHSK